MAGTGGSALALHPFVSALFLGLLAMGVVTDVRSRRIPNVLVLLLLAAGLIGALTGVSLAHSLLDALLGALAGLAAWLPFWLLGLLGAGDVKYFAAAASWVGISLSWRSSLLAAVLGGVMGVMVLIYRRGFRQTVGEVALQARHASVILADANAGAADAKARTFPYALPMAVALATAVLYPSVLLQH
jgi:prepilin peptidase CpaA